MNLLTWGDRVQLWTDCCGKLLQGLLKYCSGRKCTARTSEKIDTVDEPVLSQEDTPEPDIYRILSHFEHKYDIIVNLTFPY